MDPKGFVHVPSSSAGRVMMEALIKKQLVTAGYIERYWDNLMKIGKDKVTREYLQTRHSRVVLVQVHGYT